MELSFGEAGWHKAQSVQSSEMKSCVPEDQFGWTTEQVIEDRKGRNQVIKSFKYKTEEFL